jgi:hypothetical protein
MLSGDLHCITVLFRGINEEMAKMCWVGRWGMSDFF